MNKFSQEYGIVIVAETTCEHDYGNPKHSGGWAGLENYICLLCGYYDGL